MIFLLTQFGISPQVFVEQDPASPAQEQIICQSFCTVIVALVCSFNWMVHCLNLIDGIPKFLKMRFVELNQVILHSSKKNGKLLKLLLHCLTQSTEASAMPMFPVWHCKLPSGKSLQLLSEQLILSTCLPHLHSPSEGPLIKHSVQHSASIDMGILL